MLAQVTDEYYAVTTINRFGWGLPDSVRRDVHALNAVGVVSEWSTLRVTREDDARPDWLDGLITSRLLAARVREIVVAHFGPRDHVQWLPAVLTSADGTTHDYSLAHFPDHPDVLNEQQTTRGPGPVPIRWVIDPSKAAGLHFFHVPFVGRSTIVTEPLAQALLDAKVTGVAIKPARIA